MTPTTQREEAFPKGHPARFDYDPKSPEAIEWSRQNVHPLGERAFPVGHPAAIDTPGNLNHIQWQPGVDPLNPHLEPFTGRTPEQAAGVHALSEAASQAALESPFTTPLDAAVVNAALDAKRRELGRDALTADEYSAVVSAVRVQHNSEANLAAAHAKLDAQQKALDYLLSRGYTAAAAVEIIAREGADKILQAAAAT
jgi:hypothetical protein